MTKVWRDDECVEWAVELMVSSTFSGVGSGTVAGKRSDLVVPRAS